MFSYSQSQVKGILRRIFSRLGYRVDGLEHLPRVGPAIIIMNHTGWEEILLAILAIPRQFKIVGMRELMYLDENESLARIFDTAYAKNFNALQRYLIKVGGRLLGARIRQLLREMGYIPTRVFAENWPPVLGGNGLREVVDALEAGELVLIFPEGGYKRDGVMRPFKPGLGLILRLLDRRGIDVPVIPSAQQTAGCVSATLGNRYIPRLTIGLPQVFSPNGGSPRTFDETVVRSLQDQVHALIPS
jgi:1-acyl-sn-glycerol-3-phosphate acyltransferase